MKEHHVLDENQIFTAPGNVDEWHRYSAPGVWGVSDDGRLYKLEPLQEGGNNP